MADNASPLQEGLHEGLKETFKRATHRAVQDTTLDWIDILMQGGLFLFISYMMRRFMGRNPSPPGMPPLTPTQAAEPVAAGETIKADKPGLSDNRMLIILEALFGISYEASSYIQAPSADELNAFGLFLAQFTPNEAAAIMDGIARGGEEEMIVRIPGKVTKTRKDQAGNETAYVTDGFKEVRIKCSTRGRNIIRGIGRDINSVADTRTARRAQARKRAEELLKHPKLVANWADKIEGGEEVLKRQADLYLNNLWKYIEVFGYRKTRQFYRHKEVLAVRAQIKATDDSKKKSELLEKVQEKLFKVAKAYIDSPEGQAWLRYRQSHRGDVKLVLGLIIAGLSISLYFVIHGLLTVPH